MKRIVIMTRDDSSREAIGACFNDYDVLRVASVAEIVADITAIAPEYLFLETEALVGADAAELRDYQAALTPLRVAYPSAHLVVVSRPESTREAVKAVKAGAESYLTSPVVAEEVALVRESLEEATRAQAELDHLRDPFWADELELVRTQSSSMRDLYIKIRQVAPTRSTVLLTGETGTGKNVLAKLIHRRSNRAPRQFIGVHCGAITETLLESELFGHERGAFTGAIRRKLGKFEIADSGTLLLDEIGTISLTTQVKLLQVLQERTFQRVGGEQTIEVDVRILAATNCDLHAAVAEGSFRKDLFFRLNVFPIEIPPLRHRREDIPLLVEIFFDRLGRLYAKPIIEVHPWVLEAFDCYQWPGNVRELESLMERAYILETSSVLRPESFPRELFADPEPLARLPLDPAEPLAVVRQRAVDEVERRYLCEQLARHRGRIDATARAAGVTARQLHNLMVKHDLRKEDFRGDHRPASRQAERS